MFGKMGYNHNIYCYIVQEAALMEVNVGDIVVMRKPHPCGDNRFVVLRVGMDFKLRCQKCGHELMTPRAKIERNIKSILHEP